MANFSAQPWTGNLEVSLDGRLLDVRPFTLAAGERKSSVFPTVVERPGVGRLTAKLSADDALPLDNVAYALLPREPIRKVLLVTQGNWFLEKLLAADVRLRFELLAPEAYQPAMAANFDAVILDDQPVAALPESGNFLYLKQSPFATGGPVLEQPIVTDADSQHPALRLASLEHVSFARAVEMAIPREPGAWKFEAPLRFGDKPLLIAGERGAQRVAAFAFGLTDSDLPLRVAFPLLMANTIHWLAGGAVGAVEDNQTIGQSDNQRNGFHEVRAADGSAAWVAVNTFDERESDLRLAKGEVPTGGVVRAPRDRARRMAALAVARVGGGAALHRRVVAVSPEADGMRAPPDEAVKTVWKRSAKRSWPRVGRASRPPRRASCPPRLSQWLAGPRRAAIRVGRRRPPRRAGRPPYPGPSSINRASMIQLAHPLLLALLPVFALVLWLAQRRSLAVQTRAQRIVCTALRAFILLLLTLAIAGLRLLAPVARGRRHFRRRFLRQHFSRSATTGARLRCRRAARAEGWRSGRRRRIRRRRGHLAAAAGSGFARFGMAGARRQGRERPGARARFLRGHPARQRQHAASSC